MSFVPQHVEENVKTETLIINTYFLFNFNAEKEVMCNKKRRGSK